MPDDANPVTMPTKCAACHARAAGPVICDDCKAIQPTAASTDYFTLLGLPQSFSIDPDELRKKYLALSRHAHPDFASADSPEVQTLHLQVAASLNEAYRTLRDPAARAAYLLELLGGKSSAEDKSVPDGFLETMMMLQEELQEALAADDQPELQRLRDVLETQRVGLVRRITTLFEDYQEAVACKAVTDELLQEIRRQVNAISYVKKLLAQAKG